MIVSFGSIQLGQTALEVQNSFIYMPSTFSDYMEDDSADSLTIWSLGLFISLFSRELLHGDPALQEPETEAASSLKVWTWKRHGVTLILLSWSNYSQASPDAKGGKKQVHFLMRGMPKHCGHLYFTTLSVLIVFLSMVISKISEFSIRNTSTIKHPDTKTDSIPTS